MDKVSKLTANEILTKIRTEFKDDLGRGSGPFTKPGTEEGLREGTWAICWEGGPEDWPQVFCDRVFTKQVTVEGVFLEPLASWALGVYPGTTLTVDQFTEKDARAEFDEAAARTWVEGPDEQDNADYTVAEALGIEDDFSFESVDFHYMVGSLVAKASSETELLPEGTGLWLVAGSDGVVEGALVTRDYDEAPGRPIARLCSYYQDWRDLTWNREATGIDQAVAILRAVHFTASQLQLPDKTRIEVLHQHDGEHASTRVFVGGVEVTDAVIADLDLTEAVMAGHWEETRRYAVDPQRGTSEAFRQALDQAYVAGREAAEG